MAASPNKAVSPKDYTVCVGKKTHTSSLSTSTNANLITRHAINDVISNIPSYSIVGEYIFTYPKVSKTLTATSNYINCIYVFDSSTLTSNTTISNKCGYIRLIIEPNVLFTNVSNTTKNITFNVDIQCNSNNPGSIEIFNVNLLSNSMFNTQNKKYAVIYDLEKNEIYNDTDDPIEEWSDSNQLEIYV
jgi:hypothetical protein